MTPGRSTRGKEGAADFRIEPLVAERWEDFERLFGSQGARAGCWCMWWRLTTKEFEKRRGAANKRAMKALIRRGDVPGLLAYAGEEAVGWCAVAPRSAYPRLARSRILRPVDDLDVWSLVCLFVAKAWRGRGVATALIRGAVDHVRRQGGKAVEGYAVEPRAGRTADLYAYHGPASAFRAAGFVEVARRSPTRPIMRYLLE